jgi:hypothetical protein
MGLRPGVFAALFGSLLTGPVARAQEYQTVTATDLREREADFLGRAVSVSDEVSLLEMLGTVVESASGHVFIASDVRRASPRRERRR